MSDYKADARPSNASAPTLDEERQNARAAKG